MPPLLEVDGVKTWTATSLDQAEIYHIVGPVGSSVAGFFKKHFAGVN